LATERASNEMNFLAMDIKVCFALPQLRFWFLHGSFQTGFEERISQKVLLPCVFSLSLLKLGRRVGILKAQKGMLTAFLARENKMSDGAEDLLLRDRPGRAAGNFPAACGGCPVFLSLMNFAKELCRGLK